MNQNTPMHIFAQLYNGASVDNIFNKLVERGADVSAQNKSGLQEDFGNSTLDFDSLIFFWTLKHKGETPLHKSILNMKNGLQIAKLLIRSDSSTLNIKTNRNETALVYSVR